MKPQIAKLIVKEKLATDRQERFVSGMAGLLKQKKKTIN
jgi:hypothetical protein